MRRFAAFSLVLLLVGVWCYAANFQIYQEVGNYHPVGGYREFIEKASDDEFIQEHVEEWGASDSWVLHSLYTFLTIEDAEFDQFSIIVTLVIIAISYYYMYAALAFTLLWVFLKWKGQQNLKRSQEDNDNNDTDGTIRDAEQQG